MKKNSIVVIMLIYLNSCSAVGYLDSNDYQTVSSQGVSMERMGRFVPAEKRYLKALQIAEQKNDTRLVAHAKYNLGIFYRNPSRYTGFTQEILDNYINKSIKFLKESLSFYAHDNSGNPNIFESDIYTALIDSYNEKNDKKSACFYLNKLKETYHNKLLPHPLYSKKGYHDGFYNATGKKFSNLGELIEYYNQKIGCGI